MLRNVIRRPVSVLVATAALVVVGLFSLWRLPIALLPSFERALLEVRIVDVGTPREELLAQVIEPLERRFVSLPGIVDMRAHIDDGSARLELESEWQTDLDRLRIDVERALADQTVRDLDEVTVAVDLGERDPVLAVAVLGARSLTDRTTFADQVLIPELARVGGAGRIERIGGAVRRVVVTPLAAALAARQLTAGSLAERLDGIGVALPSGEVRDGARVRRVMVEETVTSLDELRALRIGPDPGQPLSALADVTIEERPDGGVFRLDGDDGVLVTIYRAPGANAITVAREARDVVAALERRDESYRLVTIDDTSREVVEAFSQLGWAALVGMFLGTLVLRLALGTWRSTGALVVVVPTSLVTALALFFFFGVALDVVSLAGLALAAGMLIDNSIVVLESIERAERSADEHAVATGTQQVAGALVASFLTTAVIFLPFLYIQGLARAFFGVQGFAIVAALLVSLLFSLTLTPVVTRLLGSGARSKADARWLGSTLYRRLLARSLSSPRISLLLAALVASLVAVSVWRGLDRELIPEGEATAFEIDYQFTEHVAVAAATARVAALEVAVREVLPGAPERLVATMEGSDQTPVSFDQGRLTVELADTEKLEAALPRVRAALARQPSLIFEVAPRKTAFVASIDRFQRPARVEASASTTARAEALAERALRASVTSLPLERQTRPRPSLALALHAFRGARLGVAPEAFGGEVRATLGGLTAGRVEIPGIEPEIELGASSSSTDLERAPVATADGRVVPLGALASIERAARPPALERLNARPTVWLRTRGDVDAGRAASAVGSIAREVVQAPDEHVRLTGTAHELERSFEQLRFAALLAVLFVFLTLAALYESATLPIVVMTTIPFGGVGGLLCLYLGGHSLNVLSALGLILLTGIVGNNSIVLLDRVAQRRRAGEPLADAIQRAAEERFRPIMVTTVTTLLGLLPLAWFGGGGQELRRGIALAVGGGLSFGLVASLLLVPTLYFVLARGRRRMRP